jgi:hypothetical protein
MRLIAMLGGAAIVWCALPATAPAAPLAGGVREPAPYLGESGRSVPLAEDAVLRSRDCPHAGEASRESAGGVDLLEPVAIIGNDDRGAITLAEQYRRYSFVGRVMVPTMNGGNFGSTLYATGFVATRRDIVLSVAHAFCRQGRPTDPAMRIGERVFDPATGLDYVPIVPGTSRASFAQVGADGRLHLHRMAEIRVGTCNVGGSETGPTGMRDSAAASARDWAVIRLERDVAPEVEPAPIEAVAEPDYLRLSDVPVRLVGYHADKEVLTAYVSMGTLYAPASAAFAEYAGRNYTFLSAADFNLLQAHSQLDAVLAIRRIGGALYIHDLDTKPESSGSPILEEIDGRLRVVAINSGENSFVDGLPFDLRTNQFNRATAITREVGLTIRALADPPD